MQKRKIFRGLMALILWGMIFSASMARKVEIPSYSDDCFVKVKPAAPSCPFNELINESNKAYHHKNYEESIHHFSSALSCRMDVKDYKRAKIYKHPERITSLAVESPELREEFRWYASLMQNYQDDPSMNRYEYSKYIASVLLGILYEDQARYMDAIEAYETAYAIPNKENRVTDETLLLNIGRVHLKANTPELARESLIPYIKFQQELINAGGPWTCLDCRSQDRALERLDYAKSLLARAGRIIIPYSCPVE